MSSNTSRPESQPAPPPHVQHLMFGSVELLVTVSEKNDIKGYGFAYDGVAVPMSGGKGTFHAQPGTKLLEWVMIGESNGTMKVVVTNGETVVASRDKSTIVPPETKGYDALEIEV